MQKAEQHEPQSSIKHQAPAPSIKNHKCQNRPQATKTRGLCMQSKRSTEQGSTSLLLPHLCLFVYMSKSWVWGGKWKEVERSERMCKENERSENDVHLGVLAMLQLLFHLPLSKHGLGHHQILLKWWVDVFNRWIYHRQSIFHLDW